MRPASSSGWKSLGCMFDKQPDGTMITIHGGGTSRKRMHSARDYSGAEIMRTLRDEVRSYPDQITVIEFAPAIELLLDDKGQAAGAVLLEPGDRRAPDRPRQGDDHGHRRQRPAALPGLSPPPTTTAPPATAWCMAYRVGAPLAFIDTMQYHPTGAAYPEQILGLLVTEKVRGLGAQVCNVDGEQFVFPLETRDVEAAAIIRECKERGNGVTTPIRHSGRLARLADDRHPPRPGHRRERAAGHGAPVPALRHRHCPRADAGLPHPALPERRRRHQARLQHRASPACSSPARRRAASTAATG